MAKKNGKSKKKASAKSGKRERKAFDKISAHLGDLARPSPLTFDAHGWPEGEVGEAAARAILEVLRGRASEAGWDNQPNQLAFINRPDVTVANLASAGIDVSAAMDTLLPDPGNVPDDHSVERLALSHHTVDFDGEPAWVLMDLDVPLTASALAVIVEEWVAPVGVSDRPSASPERMDARRFHLLTRTGLLAEDLVVRGREAPEMRNEVRFGHPSANGAILHACLGVPIPSDWPRVTARAFVAGLVAGAALGMRKSRVDEAMSDRAGESLWQASSAGASRAALDLASTFAYFTSDEGARLSKSDNRVLDAPWAMDWRTPLGDDASEMLADVCKRWFSQLTWNHVFCSPDLTKGFTWGLPMPMHWPGENTFEKFANWAGNDVLEALAGIQPAPTPEEILASASKDDASAVMEVLRQVGLSQ